MAKNKDETKNSASQPQPDPVTPSTPPQQAMVPTAAPVGEDAFTMLMQVVGRLPVEIQKGMNQLVSMMNPNKPGFEETGGSKWSAPVVKVAQPVSSNIPGNAKVGDLYTDLGDVLPQPFEFVPVYMYYSNAKFEEQNSNPTCRSEDTVKSIYGDLCAECNDQPFKHGEKTACNKSLNVLAFGVDFGQIYHLQFAKTSYRAGSKLYRQASATSVPWARVYSLATEQKSRTEGQGKYYILNTNTTGKDVDPKFFESINGFYLVIKASRAKLLEALAKNATRGKQVVNQVDTTLEAAGKPGGAEPDFNDGSL